MSGAGPGGAGSDGTGSDEARRRLAFAVRALGHRSLASDPGEESIVALAAEVESLVASLDGAPARRRDPGDWFRGFFPRDVGDGDELEHFADCVVSGRQNPLGIGLRARVHGDEVVGEVTLGRAHEGAPGRAHGGIVAALFDDALGYLLTVHGIVAYTGELTVRYLAGTPIGVPLTFRSRIVDRDGRRTTIAGRAVAAAEVVATASDVFVEAAAEQLVELDGFGPDHRATP